MPFVMHYSGLKYRPPSTRINARRSRARAPRSSADDNDKRPDAPPTPQPTRAAFTIDDPAQTIVWGGNLPSPRRMFLGTLGATTVALVANLAGCTSALLSIDGGAVARTLRADVLYPVTGFKRCLDLTNGFEFCYPDQWLADQTVAARQAQRRERQFSLDPPPTAPRGRQVAEPVVAFGPPGTTGEENISVIVAPIQPGFRLASLGDPTTFGATFVNTTVAPPGSGLTAALLNAQQRVEQGVLYYGIEYTVEGPRFQRHNVSVICASAKDMLYTLNVQCPISNWQRDGAALQQAAASFKLLQ